MGNIKPYPLWITICVIYALTAFFSVGYMHTDEHYQVLEPAHYLVFGSWFKAWEFSAGMRSWFLPCLYALPLQLFKSMGVTSSDTVAILLRLRET